MASNRAKITLACTACESRNYNTTKNRQKHSERVEYKKFCARCGKHTMHKETK
jgi:large subunit ribosomal protein L33